MRRMTLHWLSIGILLLIVGSGFLFLLPRHSFIPARAAGKKSTSSLLFHVPPGFVVERIAGPPLVEHPMLGCFDEDGRLFVSESAGKNLRQADLLKGPPNFLRVLEGRDAQGRFRKGRIYADKMTLPMGVLAYRGKVYSASPPSVWQLEDTDGDGVADKRRELVTKFGFSGNAASIHGPFLGPDGWLYWTDGRHGHEIRRPDGTLMKGLAARIFRCRPDGSDVEVVCGGGMDDPVKIAFTAEGEPLVTVDILHNKPSRNDGIIFAIEGGVYPWHKCYKEFKQTGDLLPAVADLGWVAPAGLMRYRSDALGKAYQGNLFSAQFNRNRIQRHIVQRKGAAFEIKTEDFLVSSNPHFHPTDVLEDADGSLLVVDTGGWFRIGCPTSQIARPEIKGGIYRIRRKDAQPVADPHGLRIAWQKLNAAKLVQLLDDPRFLVRDRAVDELAQRGKEALPALQKAVSHSSARLRRNAVWSLARMHDAGNRSLLRRFLQDKDFSVRLAAVRAVGLNRDKKALPQLREILKTDEPALRRQAAATLGRMRYRAAVPDLLAAMENRTGRFLDHALIFALIQIADREHTARGLQSRQPAVRRAALIALDQMKGGNLQQQQIVAQLNTNDTALQRAALDIISKRPGSGDAIACFLGEWLNTPKLNKKRRESLHGVLLRTSDNKKIQELVTQTLERDATPDLLRLLLLEIMAQANLDKLPPLWKKALADQLHQNRQPVVRQTIATIRTLRSPAFDKELMRFVQDEKQPTDMRLAALTVVSPRLKSISEKLFHFLAQHAHDPSPLLRLAAAESLGNGKLSDPQLLALTRVLPKAGPLELPHLLAAFEKTKDPKVGQQLVASLNKTKALTSIAPEALQHILQHYPAPVHKAAAPLFQKLKVNTAEQKSRLDHLEKLLAGGDARIGRSVFFGSKAACSTCHVAKGQGGRVGPDLSKIGGIRSERDLLEAIVFPSASFVRGYEPYLVATKEGRVHTGLLGRETVSAIFLTKTDRSEVRISRAQIDSIAPARVSIMPQGLDQQLSPAEFRDLIAYLRSLR